MFSCKSSTGKYLSFVKGNSFTGNELYLKSQTSKSLFKVFIRDPYDTTNLSPIVFKSYILSGSAICFKIYVMNGCKNKI
ncbi:hypothetical protein HERIO_922 [Hepatospora eriocheir]|uniref:Uncharacterized protein n=1 Tax=Hepatospora eriocheir TaxID=1081669 RepID=A0A1X0QBQ4_9MICR|nr:hypothetical protein HERIO_922 [Hepatospora eriocheir]